MQLEIPYITGPGSFSIAVVGAEHYQSSFAAYCGARRPQGYSMRARVLLVAANGDWCNTGGVDIMLGEQKAGSLAAKVARDFCRAVVEGGLAEYTTFECDALVSGGDSDLIGTNSNFKIDIDLPEEDGSDVTAPLYAAEAEPVAEPTSPTFGEYRRLEIAERQIDELLGIIKGVVADGMVSRGEIEFLVSWMNANRKARDKWPASAIFPRLATAVANGNMSIRDESEILDLLIKTVGGNAAPRHGYGSDSSKLPLTDPFDPVQFSGKIFCFTGMFVSGSRAWCHEQVEARGGKVACGITKKLDYLIIGEVGNDNWLHSTHGRKIEKAVQYNSSGCRIAIYSEEHWYKHLA